MQGKKGSHGINHQSLKFFPKTDYASASEGVRRQSWLLDCDILLQHNNYHYFEGGLTVRRTERQAVRPIEIELRGIHYIPQPVYWYLCYNSQLQLPQNGPPNINGPL